MVHFAITEARQEKSEDGSMYVIELCAVGVGYVKNNSFLAHEWGWGVVGYFDGSTEGVRWEGKREEEKDGWMGK